MTPFKFDMWKNLKTEPPQDEFEDVIIKDKETGMCDIDHLHCFILDANVNVNLEEYEWHPIPK